jgi:hypothetical protein
VAATRDPTKKEIAEDMDHAPWPIGPVGQPTELHVAQPLLTMSYTKYPQACKALMAFIMEADQYNKWLYASQGFLTHTLNAYDTIQYGLKIQSGLRSATLPNAHSRLAAWIPSVRRPQPPSPTLCWSICSRTFHWSGGSQECNQDRRAATTTNLPLKCSRTYGRQPRRLLALFHRRRHSAGTEAIEG